MCEDLASVKGNIPRFAAEKATRFPEFASGCLPEGALAIVIVIRQTTPERDGAFELLDGAHRLVALCNAGVETVETFIGYPRTSDQ
jgi:hypothetical protein